MSNIWTHLVVASAHRLNEVYSAFI